MSPCRGGRQGRFRLHIMASWRKRARPRRCHAVASCIGCQASWALVAQLSSRYPRAAWPAQRADCRSALSAQLWIFQVSALLCKCSVRLRRNSSHVSVAFLVTCSAVPACRIWTDFDQNSTSAGAARSAEVAGLRASASTTATVRTREQRRRHGQRRECHPVSARAGMLRGRRRGARVTARARQRREPRRPRLPRKAPRSAAPGAPRRRRASGTRR